jgi:ABC-type bacteriocin/lantibiotic exporter with double-glycine peptidase domain
MNGVNFFVSVLVSVLVCLLIADLVRVRTDELEQRALQLEIGVSSQRDFSTGCGVTSVAIAASLHGHKAALSEAKSLVAVDSLGRSSMDDLAEAVKMMNLASRGIHISNLHRMPNSSVLICHVRNTHWVVVTKNSKGALVLLDPPNPSVLITPHVFKDVWDGNALLVANSTEQLKSHLAELGVME